MHSGVEHTRTMTVEMETFEPSGPFLFSPSSMSTDVPAAAAVSAEGAPANGAAAAASASAAALSPAKPAAANIHEAKRFLLQHKEKLQMNQYWYEYNRKESGTRWLQS
jgi:uncharacterized protein YccT (UPF0319 family)